MLAKFYIVVFCYPVMESILKQIPNIRRKLLKNRNKFWKDNKRNFKKNIQFLVNEAELPKRWKIYIVASNFLFDKKVFPFDYDSWSATNLISATNKQGFEIMLFFNKARSEFLSLPALIPLVRHELYHINQVAKNPKKYLLSIINDNLSRKLEIEAEKNAYTNDEFRKEWVLESVLYCYDIGSWKFAKKMADFLFKEMKNIYGGGYERGMAKKEYELFLRAMNKKDINIFIANFI